MSKVVRVAVTGAAGRVTSSLIVRLASGEVFGPETKVILQLLELPVAMKNLEGAMYELQDCGFSTLQDVIITDDANKAFAGCNWALLVGAAPRGPGEQRKDLIRKNGPIFIGQGQAIAKNAASDVRVLVVGNPCNTNCLIAMNHARAVPADRWFAMTRLDENRAKTQIARKAGADVTAVSNLAVWGNHSPTMYPDFYNARIHGTPVPEVIHDHAWLEGEFLTTVQQRGAAIIKARGASSAASAANAVVDTVRSLCTPTPEGDWYSVSVH